MTENIADCEYVSGSPFDSTGVRDEARQAAARESVAEGLHLLEARLAALVELAAPLHVLVTGGQREPDRLVSLERSQRIRLSRVLDAIHGLHEYHRFHRQIVCDAPEAAPDWDAAGMPLEAWRRRHALRSWQAGDQCMGRMQAPGRQRYEQAVTAGLASLQQFETLDQLQAHYYDDRHHYGAAIPECPDAGTVEAWIQAARRTVAGGDELVPVVIAEASFWRRACRIDQALPSRDLWPEDRDDAQLDEKAPAGQAPTA